MPKVAAAKIAPSRTPATTARTTAIAITNTTMVGCIPRYNVTTAAIHDRPANQRSAFGELRVPADPPCEHHETEHDDGRQTAGQLAHKQKNGTPIKSSIRNETAKTLKNRSSRRMLVSVSIADSVKWDFMQANLRAKRKTLGSIFAATVFGLQGDCIRTRTDRAPAWVRHKRQATRQDVMKGKEVAIWLGVQDQAEIAWRLIRSSASPSSSRSVRAARTTEVQFHHDGAKRRASAARLSGGVSTIT